MLLTYSRLTVLCALATAACSGGHASTTPGSGAGADLNDPGDRVTPDAVESFAVTRDHAAAFYVVVENGVDTLKRFDPASSSATVLSSDAQGGITFESLQSLSDGSVVYWQTASANDAHNVQIVHRDGSTRTVASCDDTAQFGVTPIRYAVWADGGKVACVDSKGDPQIADVTTGSSLALDKLPQTASPWRYAPDGSQLLMFRGNHGTPLPTLVLTSTDPAKQAEEKVLQYPGDELLDVQWTAPGGLQALSRSAHPDGSHVVFVTNLITGASREAWNEAYVSGGYPSAYQWDDDGDHLFELRPQKCVEFGSGVTCKRMQLALVYRSVSTGNEHVITTALASAGGHVERIGNDAVLWNIDRALYRHAM